MKPPLLVLSAQAEAVSAVLPHHGILPLFVFTGSAQGVFPHQGIFYHRLFLPDLCTFPAGVFLSMTGELRTEAPKRSGCTGQFPPACCARKRRVHPAQFRHPRRWQRARRSSASGCPQPAGRPDRSMSQPAADSARQPRAGRRPGRRDRPRGSLRSPDRPARRSPAGRFPSARKAL